MKNVYLILGAVCPSSEEMSASEFKDELIAVFEAMYQSLEESLGDDFALWPVKCGFNQETLVEKGTSFDTLVENLEATDEDLKYDFEYTLALVCDETDPWNSTFIELSNATPGIIRCIGNFENDEESGIVAQSYCEGELDTGIFVCEDDEEKDAYFFTTESLGLPEDVFDASKYQ